MKTLGLNYRCKTKLSLAMADFFRLIIIKTCIQSFLIRHGEHLNMCNLLFQVYLDVAITPSETYQGLTTHLELSESAFLSNLAQVNIVIEN